MDMLEKQEKLTALAQTDTIYNTWRRSYEDAASDFETFANNQPDPIRAVLWAYAAGGRMMNQRLVNLACQHMVFPDTK